MNDVLNVWGNEVCYHLNTIFAFPNSVPRSFSLWTAPKDAADAARADGFEVFSVALTPSPNMAIMNEIADGPENVFHVRRLKFIFHNFWGRKKGVVLRVRGGWREQVAQQRGRTHGHWKTNI